MKPSADQASGPIADQASDAIVGEKDPNSVPHNDAPDPTQDASENEKHYPSDMELAPIMFAFCLSILCVALDNNIISTAIPKITDSFNSTNDIGWYGSSYLMCEAAFQILYAKMYVFLDPKWVFLTAILLFEIGSALCGASPSSTAFIIGRSIAGIGCAGILSGAYNMIARIVPLRKRSLCIGAIGAMFGLASAAGPLLGGVFTTKINWRWCFFVNLPFGAVSVFFVLIFCKTPLLQSGSGWLSMRKELDILGTLTFLCAIISLLLALQWGGKTYPWSNWRVILCLTVSGLLAISFFLDQCWKQENASIPPRVFKQRSVAAAAWFGFFLNGSFFVALYYLPMWFQVVDGADAIHSGYRTISLVLALVLASVAGGVFVAITGYYFPLFIAASILASIGGGTFCLLRIDHNASEIGFQVLYGVGVGFGIQQTVVAVQTVLEDKDIPAATAIIQISQTLGGAVWISVASNIFTNRVVTELRHTAPQFNALAFLSAGETHFREQIPKDAVSPVLQAFQHAFTQTFYIVAGLAALTMIGSLFIERKSAKKSGPQSRQE